MVKYKKETVSFWATTERGKKKKITFTARKPVKDTKKNITVKKRKKNVTIKKGKKNARK
ncbi:MAG: hypothetical protein ABIJ47_07970 [Candidatus Bathyarchaeota archaeon]